MKERLSEIKRYGQKKKEIGRKLRQTDKQMKREGKRLIGRWGQKANEEEE